MAIRAVVSLTKVDASVDHSALSASVTRVATTLDDLVLIYTPKNQIFSDSLSFAEQTSMSVVTALTDQLATDDQCQFLLEKEAAETIAFNDLLTFALTQQHDDALALTEVVSKATNTSLVDAATVSDLVVRATTKSTSDTALLADSDPNFVIEKGLIDAASLADVATITSQFSRIFADTIALSDSADAEKNLDAIEQDATDSAQMNDSLAIATSLLVSDAFALDDTSHIDKNWTSAKQNVATVTDALFVHVTRENSDAVALSDTHDVLIAKAISDSTTVADSITVTLHKGLTLPMFGTKIFNHGPMGC
jgi:hypothetical protein